MTHVANGNSAAFHNWHLPSAEDLLPPANHPVQWSPTWASTVCTGDKVFGAARLLGASQAEVAVAVGDDWAVRRFLGWEEEKHARQYVVSRTEWNASAHSLRLTWLIIMKVENIHIPWWDRFSNYVFLLIVLQLLSLVTCPAGWRPGFEHLPSWSGRDGCGWPS